MAFNCAHLFGLRNTRTYVSMYDVTDAYDMARAVKKPSEREAIYASFGLDMERVEKYYPAIQTLETSLRKSQWDIPETSAKPTGPAGAAGPAAPHAMWKLGPWKVYLVRQDLP